jgi:hypothetical protein
MSGPGDVKSPRALHPIFHGSFDWHSCVHGYWLLARIARQFSALPEAARAQELFDAQLVDAHVAGELAYLDQPLSGTFERPYGWAWLLRLHAELEGIATADGRQWAGALSPLACAFAKRFVDYLARATYPIRAGTHGNTAFALTLAIAYAHVRNDAELLDAARERALAWYEGDRACQAWEPCGDDFLSPALMEAECMRHVLAPEPFRTWLGAFLPGLAAEKPAALFEPAVVSDRTDAKICHLDGLNLSRAWCLRGVASALAADDPRAPVLVAAAERHLAAGLAHVAGDYVGEHWLATYALLALTGG